MHGLCTTLVSFGYLRRQADGAFLIGPRVMGLAEAFVSGTDVAQEFNALWADGGAAPEETVVLSVLSRQRGALRRGAQQRAPARPRLQRRHAAAGVPVGQRQGDARLAADRRSAAPLRRPALGTRLTRKGPRDIEALLKELALTRKRGYSIDDEAVREGVYSFGAPVFDASGEAVAGGRRLHQQGAARRRPRRAPSRRRARRRAPR